MREENPDNKIIHITRALENALTRLATVEAICAKLTNSNAYLLSAVRKLESRRRGNRAYVPVGPQRVSALNGGRGACTLGTINPPGDGGCGPNLHLLRNQLSSSIFLPPTFSAAAVRAEEKRFRIVWQSGRGRTSKNLT